jgi:hypothetical protein
MIIIWLRSQQVAVLQPSARQGLLELSIGCNPLSQPLKALHVIAHKKFWKHFFNIWNLLTRKKLFCVLG